MNYSNLDQVIATNSLNTVILSFALILLIALISLLLKNPSSKLKIILFSSIVIVTTFSTFILIASTIYLNYVSVSKGPVHYHADFEIYRCGEEIELRDPERFSNKVGKDSLHEHNDKKIHLEGVIIQANDLSLGNFFGTVGGKFEYNNITGNKILTLPLNNLETAVLGHPAGSCSTQGQSILQVFVYKTDGESYTQTKLDDPVNYKISPYTSVPPGDCIIIEEDLPKQKTDKLCRSYQVAKELNKLK